MSTDSYVADGENLARYVFSRRYIRQTDHTVKPDAFKPPPDLNESVTRHIGLSESSLWRIGLDIQSQRGQVTLYGRADITAFAVRCQAPLDVVSAPVEMNANHAHIIGWPKDKPSQLCLAVELAKASEYVPKPTLLESEEGPKRPAYSRENCLQERAAIVESTVTISAELPEASPKRLGVLAFIPAIKDGIRALIRGMRHRAK